MKTLFLVLIGITLVFGQGNKENDIKIDSTENNRSALKLYLVNGISIAYKKEINLDWAWQLKFDADFNYEGFDFDRTDKRIYSDTLNSNYEYNQKTIQDEEGQSFKISFHYLYNIYQFKKISSYFGGGAVFEYSRTRNTQKNKIEYNDGRIGNDWRETLINSYYIGTSFILGLESDILSYLSIIAEYELNLSYGLHENKRTYINSYNNKDIFIYDGTRTQIEMQNIKLGLILYL